jgi:transposase
MHGKPVPREIKLLVIEWSEQGKSAKKIAQRFRLSAVGSKHLVGLSSIKSILKWFAS